MEIYTNPSDASKKDISSTYLVPFEESILQVDFSDSILISAKNIAQKALVSLPNPVCFLSCSQEITLLPSLASKALSMEHFEELFRWSEKGFKSIANDLKTTAISSTFAEKETTLTSLKKQLPQLEVCHLLEKVIDSPSAGKISQEVRAVILGNHLLVAVFLEGQLQLSNIFSVASNEEVLYYVLLVVQELNLNQETLELILYGNHSSVESIEDKFNSYLRKVEYKKHPQIQDSKFSGIVQFLTELS